MDIDTFRYFGELGRARVADLYEHDFMQVYSAGPEALILTVQAAHEQQPPNVEMLGYIAGAATVKRTLALENTKITEAAAWASVITFAQDVRNQPRDR